MHDEWVTRFVDHHASRLTREMYASDLRDLSQFLDRRLSLSLPAITEEHALAWRSHLEAPESRPGHDRAEACGGQRALRVPG